RWNRWLRPLSTSTVRAGCASWPRKSKTWKASNGSNRWVFPCFRVTSTRAQVRDQGAGHRSNNHAALVHLLVELQRGEPRIRAIERIIAQDAALTFLLLRYANSAMFHYRGAIKTLFQALQLLGLKRAGSLALTMLLANHGPACMLLLSRALTRASMCERLAVEHGGDGDAAFFVGILSMMGELLGQSLHELLHELRLSPEIEAALAERSGPLG